MESSKGSSDAQSTPWITSRETLEDGEPNTNHKVGHVGRLSRAVCAISELVMWDSSPEPSAQSQNWSCGTALPSRLRNLRIGHVGQLSRAVCAISELVMWDGSLEPSAQSLVDRTSIRVQPSAV